MQVATYRTADGELKAIEYANGVFTVDRFVIAHEQVFGWDDLGVLSWASAETAEWAASLRASATSSGGFAARPTRTTPKSPGIARLALVLGGVLVALAVGAVAVALVAPTARTAPVASVGAAPEPGTPTATTPTAPAATTTDPNPGSESPQEPAAPIIVTKPATVVRVVDGDTAVFRLSSGAEEKVRFIGVDTPESTTQVEVYGREASAYTKKTLEPGRRVFLEKDAEERDRYGRLLAYVWLAQPKSINDGELRAKMFNAKLALDGYAQQMTIQPNSKYAEYFATFVGEARTADRGLWDPSRVTAAAPKEAPASTPAADPIASAYIGNRNTMKFHKPGCSSVGQMNPSNKVALNSRQQATSQGYVPCKRCNP